MILDACRKHPWGHLFPSDDQGLNEMYLPSRTLVALPTVPRKVILQNEESPSLYTKAILKHLNSSNLSIVDIFNYNDLTRCYISSNQISR